LSREKEWKDVICIEFLFYFVISVCNNVTIDDKQILT